RTRPTSKQRWSAGSKRNAGSPPPRTLRTGPRARPASWRSPTPARRAKRARSTARLMKSRVNWKSCRGSASATSCPTAAGRRRPGAGQLARFCPRSDARFRGRAARARGGVKSHAALRPGKAQSMINKIVQSMTQAMADIGDGAVVLLGGFGSIGQPNALIDGLIEHGAKDLTIVSNNAGVGRIGLARLLELGRVRKIICSYPRSVDPTVFEELYRAGKIELEIVPQGTLAERMRAAGAGIPAFFTATAVGTKLAAGKEQREIAGRQYLLEE